MSDKGAGTSFDPRIVLRPRTLDETLDLTLAYVRVYHRDFVRLVASVLIPTISVLVVLRVVTNVSWGVMMALTVMLAPFVERVVTAYAGSHLFGNDPRRWGAVKDALRRPFLATWSAVMIPLPLVPMFVTGYEEKGWIGLAIACGLFWPFILAQPAADTQVIVLERLATNAAFKRSSALIGVRYSRGLGFIFITAIARILVVIGFELIARFLITGVLQLGEPIDTLLENGGSWPVVIGYLVAAPFVALARLFDYVDARTRREGWDIQVRFKAIAARAKAERSKRIAA